MSDTPQNSEKSDFSFKQKRFIAWLATPQAKRKPPTHEELAEKVLHVHKDTLTDWKKLPGFWKAVQAQIEEDAGDSDTEVIAALIATAKTEGRDGAADRKLYLQWRNWLVEKTKTEFVNDPYSKVIAELRKEREPQE